MCCIHAYKNESSCFITFCIISRSVHKHFCVRSKLEYRLEYFDDTLQLCRTGHDDVSRTKMRDLALLLFELSPL